MPRSRLALARVSPSARPAPSPPNPTLQHEPPPPPFLRRVKSTEIALEKAAADVKGSALASDAFFPFSWGDSVEKACQAGVAAIAHPGGSMRDSEAVECCDKYGVVLVTTGTRHFLH